MPQTVKYFCLSTGYSKEGRSNMNHCCTLLHSILAITIPEKQPGNQQGQFNENICSACNGGQNSKMKYLRNTMRNIVMPLYVMVHVCIRVCVDNSAQNGSLCSVQVIYLKMIQQKQKQCRGEKKEELEASKNAHMSKQLGWSCLQKR